MLMLILFVHSMRDILTLYFALSRRLFGFRTLKRICHFYQIFDGMQRKNQPQFTLFLVIRLICD